MKEKIKKIIKPKFKESYEGIRDEAYYSELQSALRSYDTKLWQIPSLFFAVVTLVTGNINYESFFSYENTVILFFSSVFLLLLILHFYKAHFFHISIQKKINKFDRLYNRGRIKRIPLTSMSPIELKDRLKELKTDKKADFSSTDLQEDLIKKPVSSWMKDAMWLAFSVSFLFFHNYFNLYSR